MAGIHSKKILIAGAGIAGLYAADLLLSQGYEVQIVEASKRSGGKLLGGSVAGVPFDFGGQGFGAEMKRVQRLGKRLGLTAIKRPASGDFFLSADTFHVGKKFNEVRSERIHLDEQASALFPGLADPERRREWGAVSVCEWAQPFFSRIGLEYFRTNFISEWCALPENVSLLHFLEVQRGFEGDEATEMEFRYREGFSALAGRLYESLRDRVCLQAPLEKVCVTGASVFSLAGGVEYVTDAIVLAIPLPKIPSICFSGFDDGPLFESLASYGSCGVEKIILVYERRFWSGKACDGEFAIPEGMSMIDNSDPERGVFSLALFLGGAKARDVSSPGNILSQVAKVLGPEALSPIDFHIQSWQESEWLSGGYAANRVPSPTGSAPLPVKIAGRIFIAGSEAADHFPTYVEGALSSAERAVSDLAKSLTGQGVLV